MCQSSNVLVLDAVTCLKNNCAIQCQSWNQACNDCDVAFSQVMKNNPICQQAELEYSAITNSSVFNNDFIIPSLLQTCFQLAIQGCTDPYFNTYFMGCQSSCLSTASPISNYTSYKNLSQYNSNYGKCPSMCGGSDNPTQCLQANEQFNDCKSKLPQCNNAQYDMMTTKLYEVYPFSMTTCNQTCYPNPQLSAEFNKVALCWFNSAIMDTQQDSSILHLTMIVILALFSLILF